MGRLRTSTASSRTHGPKGTKGMVLKAPGLLTSTYRVRLDPDGRRLT
jgi:hypothetical protein